MHGGSLEEKDGFGISLQDATGHSLGSEFVGTLSVEGKTHSS